MARRKTRAVQAEERRTQPLVERVHALPPACVVVVVALQPGDRPRDILVDAQGSAFGEEVREWLGRLGELEPVTCELLAEVMVDR